ncbi:MAG: metallophosphoesterase [Clostridia bacterium]|nr:metallophosphoesterase [Clostridia bacterium]
MKPVIWLMIVLLLCPLASLAQAAEPTLWVATDMHYLSPSLTDYGSVYTWAIENGDGKAMRYMDEVMDAFCDEVIAKKPQALILSGDLTFNGEKQSHLDLAKKLHKVEEAGVPVLVIPGNHDLNNALAYRYEGEEYSPVDTVTAEEFREIYEPYGFSEALSVDTASLSYVYSLTPGWRVIMLDVNGVEVPSVMMGVTQLWLQEQLAEAQKAGDRGVAVSHQNLLQHSPLFSFGYVITNNDDLLALYEGDDTVAVNLSGHIHIQHTAVSGGGVPEIVTSSLAVNPSQYGVLTLGEAGGSYHAQPVDVSAWAKGSENPDLKNYSAYVHDFFWNNAYRQGYDAVRSDKDFKELGRYFADVNTAYFAGYVPGELDSEELLTRWHNQGGFMGRYIQTILAEAGVDHTRFAFDYR